MDRTNIIAAPARRASTTREGIDAFYEENACEGLHAVRRAARTVAAFVRRPRRADRPQTAGVVTIVPAE